MYTNLENKIKIKELLMDLWFLIIKIKLLASRKTQYSTKN